jgi:glutamate-1-semialdehyde 2,1-aminomutase
MGLIPPVEGFLDGLRRACDASGALLIFDEVITGFRLGEGGASAWSGVQPDLWCFGKVIGGGLPVGAFGGRREILEVLAPDGPVYQAGTLSGNPLATAAGLAVLGEVDADSYSTLSDRVAAFAAGLEKVLNEALHRAPRQGDVGIEARVPVVGPLMGLFFVPGGSSPIRDYDDAMRSATTGFYAPFFRAMLDRGVALAPGPYEIAFTSMAHSQQDLERTVEVAGEAMAEVVAH